MPARASVVFIRAGDPARVELQPDAWIVQPPGYVMVGLPATRDRERRSMTGRITNPSCGAVKVSRVH